MPPTFFRSTRNAWDAITETYNFIWPSVAGLWNLKWQLTGYKAITNGNNNDLVEKFSKGMNLRGFNFKPLMESDWENQIKHFSLILLVNIFAIYEEWTQEIIKDASISLPEADKILQRPILPTPNKNFNDIFSIITANKSTVIEQSYYPALIRNKKYNLSNLNNLLITYRLFKEIRNAYIHNGGKVDQKVVTAQTTFNNSILTNTDQGTKILICTDPQILGNNISVQIQQIVGFTEILLMAMATFDAELSIHKPCETYLIGNYQPYQDVRPIPLDAHKKYKRVCSIIKQFHNFTALYDPSLITFFEDSKLIRRI